MNETLSIHATCVAVGDSGVLLTGPSGAGKSDLALRLITTRWPDGSAWNCQTTRGPVETRLVADDRVRLRRNQAGLLEAAPEDAIAGQIEVRGLGVVCLPHQPSVLLRLAVRLVPFAHTIERFPDPLPSATWLACDVPELSIAPFEASAPAKVLMALLGRRV